MNTNRDEASLWSGVHPSLISSIDTISIYNKNQISFD